MTLAHDLRRAIEWDCERLVRRFAVRMDAGDYPGVAALFTVQGSFARPTDPDNPIVGQAAILAAFNARQATRITRHLCVNTVIEVASAASATGLSYVLLYTGTPTDGDASNLTRADARQLLGAYEDAFELTADGWRFASRRGSLTFQIG